jgi:type IV pilus assembly protein PilP
VEEKPAPVYRYNPAGRRDPFMPIIVKKEVQKGIVWGGFGYNAMIEAPDGKGYFVRTGTVLGPNRGVVKRITQSTVIIEEKYKTFSGEVQRKEIVVELRKKREGTL